MSHTRAILRIGIGVAAAVALLLIAIAEPRATDDQNANARSRAPRLVVQLVIDQFRADYIDMYGSQWTHGLRRLVDKGAVFTNARYPYGNTVTCAGHATIATGAFPVRHGMIGNTWYDRTLRKTITCAEDASATSVPLGGAKGTERYSPHNLLIPNFADELRRQTPSRPAQIVSVALKPRSAVSMGGHPSPTTTVIWEEDDGTWATSTAYASAPWPDADAYVKAHPLAAANGEVWAMFMPPAAYKYVDDGAAEAKPVPWTRNFPHTLHNPLTWEPDRVFVTAWERSPKSDEFVTGLAIELLRTRKLGQQPGTDMLSVSLPALDLVAHEFGPRSWEAQDVLARADAQVGLLLDALDKAVGPDNYLLAFSADHGVATMPDQLVAEGQDAGRIPTTMAATTLRPVLEKLLGPAPQPAPVTITNPTTGVTTQTTPMPTWIGAVDGAQVSLLPGVVDRLRGMPDGFNTVKTTLAGIKGIARVYGPDEMAGTGATDDPCLAAWRLSYVPGRTGDFVMVVKPNWIIRGATGTTHGSCYDYDQHVPVIFYGKDVKKGRNPGPATPADIAPTFAAFVGIDLPNAQGKALIKR